MMQRVSEAQEQASANSVLSPNTIKRINSYEDLADQVDELLFLSLRRTERLDLDTFETQLDRHPDEHKFLHFYMAKLVRTRPERALTARNWCHPAFPISYFRCCK